MSENLIWEYPVKKTDEEQYHVNLFYNTKYLIRDIFSTDELKELKVFLNDMIKDREEGEWPIETSNHEI